MPQRQRLRVSRPEQRLNGVADHGQREPPLCAAHLGGDGMGVYGGAGNGSFGHDAQTRGESCAPLRCFEVALSTFPEMTLSSSQHAGNVFHLTFKLRACLLLSSVFTFEGGVAAACSRSEAQQRAEQKSQRFERSSRSRSGLR